ncbi:hypothetical protein C8Q78DRAFT_1079618 [Trametes maxima]|nr:hypothetical protein C8Q78DRAFT_1079618 [Trametes maxima]
MAARPKNNLDELQRRHAASTAPARPAPATPLRSTGKPKFKPAKSIATSTPSSVTVRKLPSFSTPGFNKPKPSLPAPDLSTSAADTSNLSVISISDSDSTAFNASTSSIPAKRLSSASPDEPLPPLSPKRPKTDHVPDKENIFRIDPPVNGKGKSREQTHHFIQPSTKATVGEALLQVSSAHSTTRAPETGPAALRLGLTSLSHDPDLEEKSEEELQGVITTALALIEACNKEIGAARADAGKPRDVLLCNLIK